MKKGRGGRAGAFPQRVPSPTVGALALALPDGIAWREEEMFKWDEKTPRVLFKGELTHYTVKSGHYEDDGGMVFLGCWTTAKIRDPWGVIHFVKGSHRG